MMQKLDTLTGLKQMYTNWKILCVMPWCNYKKYSKIWLGLIFFFNIAFIFGLVVDMVLCESLKQGLYNSPFYFGCPVNATKYFIIFFMRHELWKLKNLFSLLDKNITSEEDQRLMRNGIRKVQWIFMTYNILMWFVGYSRILTLLQTRGKVLIFPMWFPFGGVIGVSVFESIVANFLWLQDVSNDMYAPCFFILLNVHMKILIRHLSNIAEDQKSQGCYSDLTACIESHILILRWVYLCNCPVV